MTTEDKTVDPKTALLNAQRLFETFDAHFQFKPGDVVALKETVEALKAELEAFGPRDRFGNRALGAPYGVVVSERILAQCHGGVQGFYHIHERDAERKNMVTRVPTHAVVPYAEMTAALKALAPPKKGENPRKDAVESIAGADLVAAAEAVVEASEK